MHVYPCRKQNKKKTVETKITEKNTRPRVRHITVLGKTLVRAKERNTKLSG